MRWLLPLVLVCALIAPVSAEEVSPEAEPPDLLLVQIRLNGFLLRDFEDVLEAADGRLWLPIEPLVQAAEGFFMPSAHDRFDISFGEALPEVGIDLADSQLFIDGRRQNLPDMAVLEEMGQLMVSAELLDTLYGFEVSLSDDRLQVVVNSQRPLPVDLRRLRERRWARFGREEFRPEFAYVPIEQGYTLWGNPRGSMSVSTGTNSQDRSLPLRMGASFDVEAAYISNRVFVSASDEQGLQTLRWTGGRTSPEGEAFGIPNLYQLEFGDVSSFGLPLTGGGGGRGVRFSTAPLSRPDLFDITVIEGDALPGWDAELYRGSELIDFQRIGDDGRYQFDDIPLGFGNNQLRVVLYGPQGQVEERVFERVVAGGQLLPGEVHWRGSLVNTGTAMFPLGREQLNTGEQLSLRTDIGVSRRLTTGAFVSVDRQDWARFRSVRELRPADVEDEDSLELINTGISLRPSLGRISTELVSVQQNNGESAWQVNLSTPIWRTSVSARYEQYSEGFISSRRQRSGGLVDHRLALRTGVPIGRLGSMTLNYDRLTFVDGRVRHEYSPRWRHRFFGNSLSHELTVVRQGNSEQSRYRLLTSRRMGPVSARGQLEASGGRVADMSFNTLNLSGDYRWDDQRTLGVSLRYGFANNSYSLSGRLSQRLGPGQISVSASLNQSGDWGAGLTYAVGLGPKGRMPLSFVPQAESSGGAIAVRIFEDVDGDGVFDPEIDRPMADAGLTLGGRPMPARSDEDGWVILAGLPSERPARIGLDRDSLMDPFLTTMKPRVELQGRPGFTHQIDFPLLDSAYATGTVLRLGRPVPGIQIKAEREDGATTEVTFSLSDGYFAFETLAPGTWEFSVDPDAIPPEWETTRVRRVVEEGQSYDGLLIELHQKESSDEDKM